ncbi:MAG: hypothetical protein RL885_28995 [Planctomycetota bacterium]
MRRWLSFTFFLMISILLHLWILFSPFAVSKAGPASDPVQAISAILEQSLDSVMNTPQAPAPQPEPLEEEPEEEQLATEDYQIAAPEELPVDDAPAPEPERETVAQRQPDTSHVERPEEPRIDSEPRADERRPDPVTRSEPRTEVPSDEIDHSEEPAPEAPAIRSDGELDAFWSSSASRPRDDQGRVLPDLQVEPFPDAGTWAAIARSVHGRVVAWDPETMDEYRIVDLATGHGERRIIRGRQDYPTVGYSSAGFDLRSLPDAERLRRDWGLSRQRMIMMMQMPPALARRLERKVALLAESLGWSAGEILACRGRWRQAPFGPWIFEIREVGRRGGRWTDVEDPESTRIFGRSG